MQTTHRTLRCANAYLYLGATILVLGAAVYVFCCKDSLLQQGAAILAALVIPPWAAYYITLQYTVTETGITRHSIYGSSTINWAELTSTDISENDNGGTASCTITLQTDKCRMSISSALLPLDEVQDLAHELRTNNLLP